MQFIKRHVVGLLCVCLCSGCGGNGTIERELMQLEALLSKLEKPAIVPGSPPPLPPKCKRKHQRRESLAWPSMPELPEFPEFL